MKYNNGREAQVGDAIVSLANHRAGVVSRVDGEKLQFLSFKECRMGEPYSLIPVTVQGKHWEPMGFEVPSETCLHVADSGQAGANLALEELKATTAALGKQLAEAVRENDQLKTELENAKNEGIAVETAAKVALTARSERIAQLEAELAARTAEPAAANVPATDPNQSELPMAPAVAIVPEPAATENNPSNPN